MKTPARRTPRWRAGLGLILLVSAGACSTRDPSPDHPPLPSADDLAVSDLQGRFEKVRDLAAAGDAPGVTAALVEFSATETDVKLLFGDEVGSRLYPSYRDEVLKAFAAEAGAVLVERVRAGQTEVFVHQVGPAFPDHTTATDEHLIAALKTPARLYSVRLRTPGQTLGFRLNGFTKLGDRWLTLLKSDAFLGAEPPSAAGGL